MCHLYSAGLPPHCLVKLKFRNQLCIDTRNVQQPIMPGFYGSAPLVYRRGHSHAHCVAARSQFCSVNRRVFLRDLARSPRRRQILVIGDCMIQLPCHLAIVRVGYGQAMLNHSCKTLCLDAISNLREQAWILFGNRNHKKPDK